MTAVVCEWDPGDGILKVAVAPNGTPVSVEYLQPEAGDQLVDFVPASDLVRVRARAAELRAGLDGLAQATRWFAQEADYTVAAVIEAELGDALGAADDLLARTAT